MSMLAEPRRKQKVINLRAKNNAWSNDSTKFGQRMLEKMGWSSGKGLGAKENGIVEHVVARYKNDEKGLGFEDKNDQWTKHEDDFDALLANLSKGDESKEKLHSGVSLEDKSKKSKARIHYHKFTRGKDLARYSEKDLANIFGKKSFKKDNNELELKDDNVEATEQKFTEKGSMEDYFKSKLAKFNSKNNNTCQNYQESPDIDVDCGFKGFSEADNVEETTQGFGFQPFSFYNNVNNTKQDDEKNEQDLKHKKNLKCRDYEFSHCENGLNIEKMERENIDQDKEQESKKNKKNKSKCRENEVSYSEIEVDSEKSPNDADNITNQEIDSDQTKKKKVKKSKNKTFDIIEAVTETSEIITETVTIKKKKSRKPKPPEEVIEEHHDQDIEVPKKKKKRKNREIIN